MKRYFTMWLAVVSFSLASSRFVAAQETTAQINGTVFDSQGAAVANAQITAVQTDTGLTRTAVSNGSGVYNLPVLPPGNYRINVKAPGFTTLEQKDVLLSVGQVLTINPTLKPGAASEVVEVSGEAPLVEASRTEIGGSVSPTEVTSLPILDRNITELMTLIPGIRQAEGFDPTKTRVGNISINGGDGRQLDINVDGGDNKDLVVGGLVQNFPVEAIQEFNVVTDQYSAEAGHSVGGVANIIVKSGTNSVHGSALGLAQLSTLNRTNYFERQNCLTATPKITDVSRCKSVFHRYDYAFSLGGPLIKDRLFAFGAFEQKREPGSIIPATGVFSDLTTFASGTSSLPGGPYAFPSATLPFPYVDSMAAVRLDYKINDKQMLFARYARQKWTNPNDQLGNTNSPFLADASQSQLDLNNFHDLSIGYNFTISADKVNSLNLHFQDMVNAISAAPTHSFNYPVAGGGTTKNPNFNFPDGTNVGTNVNVPQQTLIRKYQFRDDFNWLHGKHNFKFGVNDIYFAKFGGFFFFGANGYQAFFWNDPACIAAGSCTVQDPNNPNVTLTVPYPQGFATPGALQEVLFSGGSGSTAQPPWHALGLYWQDSYKVTPRLTINAGLRWDANIGFLRPMLGSGLTNSNRTIFALRQTLQALGGSLSGDPGVMRMHEIVDNRSDLNRTTADWKEFQPRFGFAWDISGTGKNIIRGGYGIARDQIFQNITLFSVQQTQPTIYQTIFDVLGSEPPGNGCTSGSTTFNICSYALGSPLPPVPAAGLNDLSYGGVGRIVNPKITDPWSQQFSLGWATQFHQDFAFSADYYHTLGTHEERVLNVNPNLAGPGSARLMDAAFQAANTCGPTPSGPVCGAGRLAQIYEYSTNNRSMYDGINFQLRKRMSKRVMFQTSYVLSWSRSWGGFPVASYGGSGLAVTPEQQFARNEFARTNFDERNRFTFSGLFDLPGGFQLSPIFQAASGRPYSFLAGKDLNGDGRRVLDRACVGSTLSAPVLTVGCTQLKPNTLTGKPFIQMNLRASKHFDITERAHVWLYAEFFNLFNRSNFCNSYEEDANLFDPNPSLNGFNIPKAFCAGPSNAAFGGVSGYTAFAVPSLHTQLGLRLEF